MSTTTSPHARLNHTAQEGLLKRILNRCIRRQRETPTQALHSDRESSGKTGRKSFVRPH